MAVDASKLLRRRKGLGVPPTEGAPGIGNITPVPELEGSPSELVSVVEAANPEVQPELRELDNTHIVQPKASAAEPATNPEITQSRQREAPRTRDRVGELPVSSHRQRVPPPEAEPRVPFTTRVTLSTKERLEDACYHLRRKHQDFINEAILAHLEKHGF